MLALLEAASISGVVLMDRGGAGMLSNLSGGGLALIHGSLAWRWGFEAWKNRYYWSRPLDPVEIPVDYLAKPPEGVSGVWVEWAALVSIAGEPFCKVVGIGLCPSSDWRKFVGNLAWGGVPGARVRLCGGYVETKHSGGLEQLVAKDARVAKLFSTRSGEFVWLAAKIDDGGAWLVAEDGVSVLAMAKKAIESTGLRVLDSSMEKQGYAGWIMRPSRDTGLGFEDEEDADKEHWARAMSMAESWEIEMSCGEGVDIKGGSSRRL
jgi:hypothetical protein